VNTTRNLGYEAMIEASGFARRVLWHLFSIDTSHLNQVFVHQAYEKPGVHVFWVVSGQGTLEIQGETYDLVPGNCVWFINMAQTRTYRPLGNNPLVKQGFRFGGPAVDLWHKEFGSGKKARFYLKNPKLMHEHFWKICQLSRQKPPTWEWQVHLTITSVLGELAESRNLLAGEHMALPPPVVRVLNILATNPFYDWRVKDLVAASGVSYSVLHGLFLQTQGRSLHQFIQERRLDQAKLLLADDELSIKQIAEQMHFSDEYYFSHFFKRLSRVSPTAFRMLKGK
jgi:AraC-like DNA-binding protein